MPAVRIGKRDPRRTGKRPKGTYEYLINGGIPDLEDMDFGGSTYDPELDQYRLGTQLQYVWAYMQDERWHTPEDLEENVHTGRFDENGEERHFRWASISARLRDFRKPENGGHDIEGKRLAGGSWKYRLVREDDAAPVS